LKPALLVQRKREMLNAPSRRLSERIRHLLAERRGALSQLSSRLQLLGPENVLARGYSITLDDATGRILRDAAETRPRLLLRTRLQKGEVKSVVQ
jgi:exodeoxyribonuclease VII large subunit